MAPTPEHPDLEDDDALIAGLGRALDALEPVPADAMAVARAALDLSRADAALAELVSDSLADSPLVPMRDDALLEARALAFTSLGHRVDVELLDDGAVLLGQLDPPEPAEVVLERPSGARTTSADDLGRFRFDDARGPVRLRITTSSAGAILTPWITW